MMTEQLFRVMDVRRCDDHKGFCIYLHDEPFLACPGGRNKLSRRAARAVADFLNRHGYGSPKTRR